MSYVSVVLDDGPALDLQKGLRSVVSKPSSRQTAAPVLHVIEGRMFESMDDADIYVDDNTTPDGTALAARFRDGHGKIHWLVGAHV